MIKFFRKFRQSLLKDQKPARYLFYAAGEILLVMVGILLALQVNNWNQDRYERKEEAALLAKLNADFQENKTVLVRYKTSLDNSFHANLTLINLVGKTRQFISDYNVDSLLYESFTANELAFADNTVKSIVQSARINIFKNNHIAELLYRWNSLAEIRKNRIDKLDNWNNNHFLPYLINKISFKEMDGYGNMEWAGKSSIKPDYHPLFQQVELENYLDNTLWYRNQIRDRVSETESLIDEIIEATKL